MREMLLSLASPEMLSSIGFVTLAISLLGEVAVLVVPTSRHLLHSVLGLIFAAGVLIGYLIGHIGDDEAFRVVSNRASSAEAQLKALTKPRDLTPEQQANIAKKLKQFSGTTFEVVTYPKDKEPSDLAGKIASAVTDAGWVRTQFHTQLVSVAQGVHIALNPTPTDAEIGAKDALVDALNAEGIATAFAGVDPSLNGQKRIAIQIAVTHKP